jgi:hypothetical protein
MLLEVVDVDGTHRVQQLRILHEGVLHFTTRVQDVAFRTSRVALRRFGDRKQLEEVPEELHVEVAFGVMEGAVVQFVRAERV